MRSAGWSRLRINGGSPRDARTARSSKRRRTTNASLATSSKAWWPSSIPPVAGSDANSSLAVPPSLVRKHRLRCVCSQPEPKLIIMPLFPIIFKWARYKSEYAVGIGSRTSFTRASFPPSIRVETCRVILIVRSSARPRLSSLALWSMKGKYLRRYKEASAFRICCGLARMGTSTFSLLSSWGIPCKITLSYAEEGSVWRQSWWSQTRSFRVSNSSTTKILCTETSNQATS